MSKKRGLHVLCLLPLLLVVVTAVLLIEVINVFPHGDNIVTYNFDRTHPKGNVDLFNDTIEPSTQFITHCTLKKWSETDFLVVFGIPSDDNPGRKRLRDLQRENCWSYDGVATLANEYTGVMTALYVTGLSPSNQFKYSTALKAEAHAWQDILTLPIREGEKSTNKQIGADGFWGIDAEIGMSRKTFLWFYMALHLFPKALHVAKADDDIFVRVPAYLEALRVLPRKGIYWGLVEQENPTKFGAVTRNQSVFSYAGGACMTLAKDMVEKFISYKPLHRMIFVPYNESRKSEFRMFAMQHEDVMVGLILHNAAYPNIVYVRENPCRFHNVYNSWPLRPVTTNSLVIHHLKETDHKRFRDFFQNKSNLTDVLIERSHFNIVIKCPHEASLLSL